MAVNKIIDSHCCFMVSFPPFLSLPDSKLSFQSVIEGDGMIQSKVHKAVSFQTLNIKFINIIAGYSFKALSNKFNVCRFPAISKGEFVMHYTTQRNKRDIS